MRWDGSGSVWDINWKKIKQNEKKKNKTADDLITLGTYRAIVILPLFVIITTHYYCEWEEYQFDKEGLMKC